jgi:hypothetical protein
MGAGVAVGAEVGALLPQPVLKVVSEAMRIENRTMEKPKDKIPALQNFIKNLHK